MTFDEISQEIITNAVALEQEVISMAEFLDGRAHLFRHALFGYLMACMGQIDVMSFCMFGPDHGPGRGRGYQTIRMLRFMEQYIDPNKTEQHRVAIQLMRHTLMHTGALRYPYDETNQIAYTWQAYFGDTNSSTREHYSLTVEDQRYQDHLLEASQGRPIRQIKALNFRVVPLAGNIVHAADAWHRDTLADQALQDLCESNFSSVRFQVFNRIRRP